MHIVIPFPSLAAHGGTRVAVAIANHLALRGHEVSFYVLDSRSNKNYWTWHKGVKYVTEKPTNFDVIFITSPHSIHLAEKDRTVLHLQMLEHMFRPNDVKWRNVCEQMYTYPAPMFTISGWNRYELITTYKRREDQTIYIGNGVDFNDFPLLDNCYGKSNAVLVEGWVPYNPCKDEQQIAPKVALRLRSEGYYIVGYGQLHLKRYVHTPHEYHLCPSLHQLNQLYSGARILLKASKYDARACAPVEAMTKGVPTVRALVHGDDDLINDYNCLRTSYSEQALYAAAKKVLTNDGLYDHLQYGCMQHIRNECKWDKWIDVIEKQLKEMV